jgi:endogenous inhibitor of DNA gyrase (YacG/DUF329 family)
MNDCQILLKSLTFASRRENVLSLRYPNLYNEILDFNISNIDITFKQKVFNYMNNITEIPKCKICNKNVNFYNNIYSIYCSNKCQNSDTYLIEKSNVKRLETMQSKYGVNYTFDMQSTKDKIKKTLRDKYDTDHISRVESVKKNLSISKKRKVIERYINDKSISLIKIDDNRVMTIRCDDCDEEYEINYVTYLLRIRNKVKLCTKCNRLNNYKSSIVEKNILDFVSSYDTVIPNYKISNYEIDVYLPNLGIGIEFNGLYWHSEIHKENNYHLFKTNLAKSKNIFLFHIWEDDWTYKQDIVKSMILNKLGKTSNRIYGRKTEVKELNDNLLVREFLDKNHIQGFIGSKIKLGLYYNGELVSLMTFGNLRKSLGQKSGEGYYELLRFCNKLNTNVIGGASKLFKYFINNFSYKEIISYSDLSRSTGDMYQKLGFKLQHNSDPNYYYVIDGVRSHRFNFRKDKLVREGFDPNKTEVQIMNERGYYRIFDCGMQKWSYGKM